MGFLDFARDVGSKIFSRDAEAAENIKQHLDISLTDASKIDVGFDDGCVTLSGECDSQKTKELATLLAGNVKGVERVVADALVPRPPAVKAGAPAPEPEPQVEYYEIKSGDTLGAIAKRFYGKASAYTKIFEANREVIKDANKIYPGQKIRIPKE